jgi:hypothetical protein
MSLHPDTNLSCPNCDGVSRHLLRSSRRASVEYLRCEQCSEIWTLAKRFPADAAVETQP